MLTHRGFHPIWSKVSLDAEYHNPSILTPRFLTEFEIVPNHWQCGDANSSARYAEVNYQHNFSFSVGDNVLEIEDLRRGVGESEPTVFQIAARYLEVVQLVNYTGLDVTLRSDLLLPDAYGILHRRFLHPFFQSEDLNYLRMTPRFVFTVGDWSITLRFSQGNVRVSEGETSETLSAEVFANFSAPLNVDLAHRAARDWPTTQEVVERVAEDLLWREYDDNSEPS